MHAPSTLAPLVLLPPPPKKRRRRYTSEHKLRVLKYADAHTSEKASVEFEIGADTIRRWRQKKHRDRIEAACSKKIKRRRSMALPTGLPAKARTTLPAEVELELYEEVMAYRSDRIPIDGVFVQTLALAKAEACGICIDKAEPGSFRASNGWLTAFKNRHNLTTRTGTRRKMTELSEESIKLFYRTTQKLRSLIRTGRYSHIVNIDEVPIYYDVNVKKTLDEKGAKEVLIADGGDSKRRITAVFGIISALNPDFEEPMSPRCKSMYILRGKRKRSAKSVVSI